MIKSFVLAVLLLAGIFLFPLNFSWSQSVDPEAAEQIQKLSQQSQKLMDEYKAKKKDRETELQQKLKALTNSPADRLRRRQWMEETNQKLRQLQEDFNLEMNSIEEVKDKLTHPRAESDDSAVVPVPVAPKPRAISDEELKEKIKEQDELFPRTLPVEDKAVEKNPQAPGVSVENSSNKNTPPSDKESSKKSRVNTY